MAGTFFAAGAAVHTQTLRTQSKCLRPLPGWKHSGLCLGTCLASSCLSLRVHAVFCPDAARCSRVCSFYVSNTDMAHNISSYLELAALVR